jgi:hypothetical protein
VNVAALHAAAGHPHRKPATHQQLRHQASPRSYHQTPKRLRSVKPRNEVARSEKYPRLRTPA